MASRNGIVAWVLAGVCAVAGTLATYLPEGQVQQGADTAAQVCEASGFTAYPRQPDGGIVPRPEAEDDGRRVGLVRQGNGFAPVLVPAGSGPRASSTVEDVGEAQ
ncbi:hypothetical protein [Myxococcus sp. RHSTA-1-4]|uniref:hypothetical protein n=1 Tax=Myxococcus sp. RHSTA-1-4 TaxID=2874601 RepID=UPI001CBCAC10|nr:hypothetical protein [Myxococcus sp. RHSTA-1-4]MBZ4422029.1 hypothetical protein [Myxococcus sp. RHSTA-1-4]